MWWFFVKFLLFQNFPVLDGLALYGSSPDFSRVFSRQTSLGFFHGIWLLDIDQEKVFPFAKTSKHS